MAFFTQGQKKLPNYVTQEEFEQLFQEIIKQEKRSTKIRRRRLRQYRVAILLGFEAGMRISEIVGWKVIPKLEKKNINEVSILILGKGGKERVVPRPKRLSEKAKELFPLSISRRALQSYIEKLGDEVLHRHISFHCVDAKTEVLTEGGWKKYNEIKEGEDIFTYNLEKDKIELFKTREIFSKPYSGEMYHIKNKYIDSLVTPEHKIIAKYSTLKIIKGKRKDIWNSSKWNLIPLDEIISNKSLRQIKYKLSGLKSNWNNGRSIGKDKAGILGWILSDGHIAIKDKDITIQQSLTANKDKCEVISKLLNDSGLKFYIKIQKEKISDYSKRKSQIIVFRISKESSKWIFDYINIDRTPILSSFLKLNREELDTIYKNMMLGDGTIRGEYCGQDINRINFIRILCCLLNKKTLIGKKLQKGKEYFRTYITEQTTCDIHRNITKENYKGIVWCPSTPNGTFIARRNGTIFLTGNTLRHGFGSHLAGQGRPLHEIQMLMGHSRLDTTGIYMHANPKIAIEKAREVF